ASGTGGQRCLHVRRTAGEHCLTTPYCPVERPVKRRYDHATMERDVERLVRENQKLVHFQVNRYLQRYFVGDMEREDLVSWGMIGLTLAARAWDPERSSSFSTLACRTIERMIIRGVRREWKPERAASTVSLDD